MVRRDLVIDFISYVKRLYEVHEKFLPLLNSIFFYQELFEAPLSELKLNGHL